MKLFCFIVLRKGSVLTSLLSAIGVLLAASPRAGAATSTWNGNSAGSSNWTDGGNWSGGVPTGGGTGFAIVFDGVKHNVVNEDASNVPGSYGTGNYGTITFPATAGAFIINQGASSMLGFNGSLSNNSPNVQTINIPMQLIAANPGSNVVISVTNSGSLFINRAIGENPGSHNALLKAGAGTLILGSANTFSGGATVSAGLLIVQAGGGLGTGNVQVASGASLTLSNAAVITSTANLLLADSTATVNLNFTGTNLISQLSFDGGNTFQADGTWGSPVSSAQFTDGHFTGTGVLSVQGPASLQIQVAGANLQLTWPSAWTSLSLYSASNLTAATAWQMVTNPLVVQGSSNVVTLLGGTNSQYFQLRQSVDPTTMYHKLLMGYQGWFGAPGDGSANNAWFHWFHGQTPTVPNINMDFMPDVSELDPDELRPTQMTNTAGATINVYSAYNQKTVVRHMKWMKDYNLDGVFLQRFASELSSPNLLAFRDQVTANIRLGAETYGRVFAIMYDISGQSTNTLVSTLTNDWTHLTGTLHVTQSPRYLNHNGKPVVAIWGFGFSGRLDTPAMAQTTIAWFKAAGCTVMGGLPTNWRTQPNGSDTQTNAAWAAVFRSFDVISPWAVGRYGTTSGVDSFRTNQIVPDLADATANGRDYLPVVFPGFSWTNETRMTNSSPLNQTPRNAGTFYWRQIYDALLSGCTMIYGAMYDECDEGTAMYKLDPTPAQMPAYGDFGALNVDGTAFNSDWYLRLAGQAGRMLRGEIPLQSSIPISPP